MKAEARRALFSFLIELVVYAGLVFAYFFLVLHFLGGWLAQLYREHPNRYAFIALALMIGQGVVLEMVTSALLRFIRNIVE